MSLRRLVVTLFLAGAPVAQVTAQQPSAPIDPAKLKSIYELIAVSHGAEIMASSIINSLPAQRQAHSEVPAAFWDVFARKATEQIPMLIDSLVPIYARHFTQNDLDQIIAFYQTPAGQHSIAEQPAILVESIDLGRRWGMQMGRAIGDSLARAESQ